MNAQTTKTDDGPMATYEYVGTGDVPTHVSVGTGVAYYVVNRRLQAPARFAQGLGYLGFEARARGKPKVEPGNGDSRGIGATMGDDRSKKGASK
jgi:hypothetical protein